LAVDLVEFDPMFNPAMQQAFGKVFICEDQKTARTVMEKYKYICVTKDGDKYEPSGTLHGGSQQQNNILLKVQAFKEHQDKGRSMSQALYKLQEEVKMCNEQTRVMQDKRSERD
jgi:structural maintenance of chromosome 2